jgi:hypothetical protein
MSRALDVTLGRLVIPFQRINYNCFFRNFTIQGASTLLSGLSHDLSLGLALSKRTLKKPFESLASMHLIGKENHPRRIHGVCKISQDLLVLLFGPGLKTMRL